MSKQLLYHLNGRKKGPLRRWLDNFQGEPRIAWYPSAGHDFRDLLYLHPKFSEMKPASKAEPQPPDIFLHTDYFPWSRSLFLDNRTIHQDNRTTVTVKSIEELPKCNLPLDGQIVDFPRRSQATGRTLFLEIEIQSNRMGNFTAPVIYSFVENAAFCAERILPENGKLSHVVHVRFGGGCGGGGKSTGIWLLNVLRTLHCEIFVTDGHYGRQSGDKRIYTLYPSLAGREDTSQLEQIRVIHGEGWSDYGDVSWNIIKQANRLQRTAAHRR